jgi:hypothetical protein
MEEAKMEEFDKMEISNLLKNTAREVKTKNTLSMCRLQS